MKQPPKFQALAVAWEELLKMPTGFTCCMAAEVTKEFLGGQVMGYWADDNPTAELGKTEGGHEFLIVEDKWILDFWAAAYYTKKPIYSFETDAEEIARLYGDRSKWEIVQREKQI